MKKLLIFIAIGAVVLVGGKFYLEGQYKKELDRATRLASAVVDINYDDLKIGFDGSISLLGLSVRRNDGEGAFKIEKIIAVSSDRLAPLKRDLFKNGEFPEWMTISVDKFSFESALFEPKLDDECKTFDASFIYSEIGIDRVIADMEFSFNFRDLDRVETTFKAEDQVASTELQFNFSMNKAQQMMFKQESLPFEEIRMTSFLEASYASGLIDYCATKSGMTASKYLSEVVASPKYSIHSFGLNFGEKISKALVEFVKGGANLTITSRPSAQLAKIKSLKFYDARNIIRWLNLSIMLNEKPIAIDPNANNNLEELEAANNKDQLAAAKRIKRKYYSEPISSIPKYVGSRVRINRKGEKSVLEGRIKKYSEGIVFVQFRRYGGIATYEVPIKEVKSFEVLR